MTKLRLEGYKTRLKMILALILVFLVAGSVGGELDAREIYNSSYILAKIETGVPVDLSNVIIEGDINIKNFTTDNVGVTNSQPPYCPPNMKIVASSIRIFNSELRGNLDLSNVIFEGPVDFTATKFTKSSLFSCCQFNDSASFSWCQFDDIASFSGSLFSVDAHFDGANFSGNTSFGDARFGGNAYFDSANFNGDAKFDGTNFSGDANFAGANFSGNNAGFRNAQIGGYAKFGGVNFSDGAIFSRVDFSGDANFSGVKFGDDADFKEAEFGGDVNFDQADFSNRATFNEIRFNRDAKFEDVNINGDAEFNQTQFCNEARFSGSRFDKDAYFVKARFDGDANFEGVYFNKLVTFEEAEYDGYALFENSTFSDTSNICFNRIQCDKKIRIRWKAIEGENKLPLIWWDDEGSKLIFDEEAYLNLYKNYRDLGWFEDANKCYYEYMKLRRCDSITSGCINTLLHISYGYGTKPEYSLYWSVALMAIFGFIWSCTEIREPLFEKERNSRRKISKLADPYLFSAKIFLSGTKLFVDPPKYRKPPGWRGSAVKILFIGERTLGMALFFLFIFAVSASMLIKII
jgi:hypothetical protein